MWNGFWACLDEMRSELITIHKKKSSLWNFKYLQIITSIHVSDGLLRWPNICWTPCLDMYVSTELAPEISCCATSPKASDCRNTDLMKAVLVETHVFVDIHDVSRTSASGIDEQITWLVKTRDWIVRSLLFTSQLSWDQLICMEDSLLARQVAIANQQSSCSILPANWNLGVMEVWCQGCRNEKVKSVAQQNCECCKVATEHHV